VRGVERLRTPIKFIWNFSGNTLINQHSDINRTRRVLEDESKVEFILVIDNQMSVSARWADVILPDVVQQENFDYVCNATTARPFVVAMQPAVKPRYEERSAYEICRGIARRFGIEDKYTEGRTQEQWVEWCYETMRTKLPELPPFVEFWKAGVVKVPNKIPERAVALSGFRKDPEKNRLKTPSGKIEIYSEQLARIAREWTLPDGDVITPLPQYVETWEMHGDPKAKQYPLQAFGYHAPGHTHSTFANLPWMRELHPDRLLINPIDAGRRGIANGDEVVVFNDRGVLKAKARVTPRIIPGLVTLPQGGWYRPDKDGVDHGASVNVLTSLRPSPLGKHNPQHTNLVEVRKA
jgi:anaerobic selenocysteine-containing dehydrogenase